MAASTVGVGVADTQTDIIWNPFPALMTMDHKAFSDMAMNFATLPMFPVFDIAHYTLAVMYVRHDSGIQVSRRNPLACWMSSMITCFAGAMLANFLLGLPIIAPFEEYMNLVVATVVWYLVFYSPFDLYYKLLSKMLFKIPVYALKEVQRARKISAGITQAASLYPEAFIIMIVTGAVKGAGASFTSNLEKLVRGVWSPTSNEFLYPSFALKASVLGAVTLVSAKFGAFGIPYSQVVLVVSLVFVYFKVSMLLLGVRDPFALFEYAVCTPLFGRVAKPDEPPSKPAEDLSQKNPANTTVPTKKDSKAKGE